MRSGCLLILWTIGGIGTFGLLACSGRHLPANDNGTGGGHGGSGGGQAGSGGGQAGAAAGASGTAGAAGSSMPSGTGGAAGAAGGTTGAGGTGGAAGATGTGGSTGQAGHGGAAGGTASLALSLLAGGLGGPGNVDGTGATARFTSPYSVASDGAGSLYVADNQNHTIRKIVIATGAVTTLAGAPGQYGSADGTGAAARFQSPVGVASDGAGNLYIADTGNDTIRKIVIATGAVTTLAGMPGFSGSANGTGAAARFNGPFGVAGDGAGNLYVSDTSNDTIRKIVIATGAVTTLAGAAGQRGDVDAKGAAARFDAPGGIASDGAGNLYVADIDNYAVRKIVIATATVTTFAGAGGQIGSVDGTGTDAHFSFPTAIASDGAGNLYVTDNNNDTIRKIVIATAAVTTLAGAVGQEGAVDGTGGDARFRFPFGIASDGAGNLYVADNNNDTIRRVAIATAAVTTLAGAARQAGTADGTGAAARFQWPRGIAGDGAGNVYVVDGSNNTIRKVAVATGAVTTLAGAAGVVGSTDGIGAAARFNAPIGIASDNAGNLYLADSGNSTIRKVEIATGTVATLAGAPGQWGNTDGTGAAARFFIPSGIASDGAGNLYVVDSVAIRKVVMATGAVTTVVARPGSAEDMGPPGIASDGAGNLYLPDTTIIQKIAVATGTTTTLAGSTSETGTADGTGTAARFNLPRGIASDGAGNLYVADGNTIRKVVIATATVSTVVGVPGRIGASPGALPASLNNPYGVVVLPTGELTIVDTVENAVLIAHLR